MNYASDMQSAKHAMVDEAKWAAEQQKKRSAFIGHAIDGIQPAPLAPIPSAINTLGGDIDTMNEIAQLLIKRLYSVLSDTAPEKETCAAEPLQSTNMGSQIEGLRLRVNAVTESLQSAINRLAL